MEKVIITINDEPYQVDKNLTVLEAARILNIEIPTLCAISGLDPLKRCGLCKVMINGKLEYSCSTLVANKMIIYTDNEEIKAASKKRLEEIVNLHSFKCGTCLKKAHCELLKLMAKLGVRRSANAIMPSKDIRIRKTYGQMTIDADKCILCGRCVNACKARGCQTALKFRISRYDDNRVLPVGLFFDESNCIYCGQCVSRCPVDAIHEASHMDKIKKALTNPSLHPVVAIAPSIRVSIGDDFGYDIGENVEGALASAFRQLGFKAVFDLSFTADLTAIEEGEELIKRIKNGGPFPLYTSCCPGWVESAERVSPESVSNISTTKSPQQMFGALAKSYYAQKNNIDPRDMFTVTIVPCTAKKSEAEKNENHVGGIPDVDAVLTTRELAALLREKRIDLHQLQPEPIDHLLGNHSRSGVLFGASGGVLNSAIRYIYYRLEGKPLEKLNIEDIANLDGIKTTSINIAGKDYNIAIINGVGNISRFRDEFLLNNNYLFVEVMACNGGCIAGGGQPYLANKTIAESELIKKKRIRALRDARKSSPQRDPQENTELQILKEQFLSKISPERYHQLLHTSHNITDIFTSETIQDYFHDLQSLDDEKVKG